VWSHPWPDSVKNNRNETLHNTQHSTGPARNHFHNLIINRTDSHNTFSVLAQNSTSVLQTVEQRRACCKQNLSSTIHYRSHELHQKPLPRSFVSSAAPSFRMHNTAEYGAQAKLHSRPVAGGRAWSDVYDQGSGKLFSWQPWAPRLVCSPLFSVKAFCVLIKQICVHLHLECIFTQATNFFITKRFSQRPVSVRTDGGGPDTHSVRYKAAVQTEWGKNQSPAFIAKWHGTQSGFLNVHFTGGRIKGSWLYHCFLADVWYTRCRDRNN